MAAQGLMIRAVSRFFSTPCFPLGAGPDYVNAAVVVRSDRPAQDLLDVLHGIESEMGRTRATRWGMRTLDLDLIAHGDEIHPNIEIYQSWVDLSPEEQKVRAPDRLLLPHPRLAERAFVLMPLADIVPHWIHPVTGLRVDEMLDALPLSETEGVRAL